VQSNLSSHTLQSPTPTPHADLSQSMVDPAEIDPGAADDEDAEGERELKRQRLESHDVDEEAVLALAAHTGSATSDSFHTEYVHW
jgi:hypothetical protein